MRYTVPHLLTHDFSVQFTHLAEYSHVPTRASDFISHCLHLLYQRMLIELIVFFHAFQRFNLYRRLVRVQSKVGV